MKLRTSQSFDFSKKYNEIIERSLNQEISKNIEIKSKLVLTPQKDSLVPSKESQSMKIKRFTKFLEDISHEKERKDSENKVDDTIVCTLNTSLLETTNE